MNSAQCPRPEFKIFRVQAMWMLHEDFKGFITTTWNNTHGNIVCKTTSLAKALTGWNNEVFDNVFQQKKKDYGQDLWYLEKPLPQG